MGFRKSLSIKIISKVLLGFRKPWNRNVKILSSRKL